MNTHQIISWAILSLLLVPATVPAATRPNVIVIVTDDQGYGDMSCHGNPWLRTPNLDRLFAESMRLEDCSIRLSRFPDDAPEAMRTTKVVLKVGNQELEKKLQGNETSATFMFDLPQGLATLQSWLWDKAGVVRGAYFVQVERQ